MRGARLVAKTRTFLSKDFLAAYVKARALPLERCTTTVLLSGPSRSFTDISRVYRGGAGEDGPFEEVDFDQLMGHHKKVRSGEVSRPKDASAPLWWYQQTKGMKFKPLAEGRLVLPRRALLPHQVGYPAELLTLGQSPVDNPDCKITLDRKPVKGPAGTVLLRIKIETAFGFNNCFFWIAPDRNYMVLRHEIHFSKDQAAWNNSTPDHRRTGTFAGRSLVRHRRPERPDRTPRRRPCRRSRSSRPANPRRHSAQ